MPVTVVSTDPDSIALTLVTVAGVPAAKGPADRVTASVGVAVVAAAPAVGDDHCPRIAATV